MIIIEVVFADQVVLQRCDSIRDSLRIQFNAYILTIDLFGGLLSMFSIFYYKPAECFILTPVGQNTGKFGWGNFDN